MTKEQATMLVKKLEYKFKTSDKGQAIVTKINSGDYSFTKPEIDSLIKKLEYKFKTSDKGKSFIAELS